MSKLSSYRLLSFDVYGTLVDWETGIHTAFAPLLEANNATTTLAKADLLQIYTKYEGEQQTQHPEMKYTDVLAAVYTQVAAHLGFPPPSADEAQKFGGSVGRWPAFPDTVDALHRLGQHYKLVVLSNVNRDSFQETLAGPLAGVQFDAVLTAQDIGSYKPDARNFEYMLAYVRREFGIEKGEVLQTAQSQFHDHHPARRAGIKSVWIERPGNVMGNVPVDQQIWDWKFTTMGDMADALDEELKSTK